MSLTLTPSTASSAAFDNNHRNPITVTVSGGAGPYSATSSNPNIATVTQGTSPNLISDADTLSGWTLSGLTQGTGGPNGSTDAEYTGTGSAITSGLSLTRTVAMTMGQSYTPSWWVDMSQVTHGALDLQLFDISGTTIQDINGGAAAGNAAQRYAGNAWTCPTNGVPFSDSMAGGGWNIRSFVYGTGGPGGATDIEYTVPSGQPDMYAQTAPIPCTPGTTVAFSVWCNPSICTSGGLWLLLFDYTGGTIGSQIKGVTLTGSDGRKSTTFTVPAGCTQYVALLRENSGIGVIPAGSVVKFSQPMSEVKSAASGYYISSQNPQVKMQLFAWNRQPGGFIVANGQKFKVGQPMFALSTYDPNTYVSPTGVWQIAPKIGGVGGTATITYSDSTP